MSHKQNTEWIESAWERFDELVTSKDFAEARLVRDDTKDSGFASDAERMTAILIEAADED